MKAPVLCIVTSSQVRAPKGRLGELKGHGNTIPLRWHQKNTK